MTPPAPGETLQQEVASADEAKLNSPEARSRFRAQPHHGPGEGAGHAVVAEVGVEGGTILHDTGSWRNPRLGAAP